MASKIPAGLIPIGSLPSHVNREVNLMGVVTDFQPAARSRGKDWTCNFRLADSTTLDDGFKVRFFKPMEIELPKIESNGDVVILGRVKITSWSGMVTGLSTHASTWIVFPAVSIPEKASPGPLNLRFLPVKGYLPSQEHMRYAVELCNSRERSRYDASAPITISSSAQSSTATTATTISTPSLARRDKFALVKDVQIDKFYDLVGQVLKVYPGNGVVELYLTDYTSHQSLYNYEWGRDDPDTAEDEGNSLYGSSTSTNRKWPGPYGKHTLTVSLFSPHSYYAQNHIKESQFVFLRNVRIKFSKDAKMEGSLHTDRHNPDRVDVTILHNHSDERVKEVLRRKLQYGKQFQRQQEAFVQQHSKDADNQGEALAELTRGQKRKQAEQPKLTKAQQRKRKRKKQEEERQKRLEDAESSEDEGQKENTDPNADPYRVRVTHKPPKPTRLESPPPPKKPSNLNKNIRTNKPNIPTRPLTSILSLSAHALTTPKGTPYTLPFQNIKSRALVRIVDFFPPDIADFAVRKKRTSEFDVLSECSGESSSSEGDDRRRLPDDTDSEDDATSQRANDDNDGNRDHTPKWQWRFALVLEDASSSARPTTATQPAPERLTAYVTDADAVFLLKLDACNLRRRSQALAALRERLFLLWGDLEERKGRDAAEKRAEASSMPFECCIKEYGVRSRRQARAVSDGCASGEEEAHREGNQGCREEDNWGWERKFAMFGTTIL
ncbi:MAG: hypothetical protein Q9208_007387 [Pyrenodesmia sp. 3 TL-2023]